MIEPLGHEAEAHATRFEAEKDATYERLTQQFEKEFCDSESKIDWPKLVRFVSENMPPEGGTEKKKKASKLTPEKKREKKIAAIILQYDLKDGKKTAREKAIELLDML